MFTKEQNIENLRKMAEWLETKCTQEEFEMYEFCRSKRSGELYLPDRMGISCDTVGCIIGSIPKVFELDVLLLNLGVCKDWFRLEQIVFNSENLFSSCSDSMDRASPWNWLFDSAWAYVDNTPTGAAKRIRYFLANKGKIPEWYCPKLCEKFYTLDDPRFEEFQRKYREEVINVVY